MATSGRLLYELVVVVPVVGNTALVLGRAVVPDSR